MQVEGNTAIIDFLIDVVLVPDIFRYGEFGQCLLYGLLNLDIAAVVRLEEVPFFRKVLRQVAGPAAVGLRRRTRRAVELYKVLALTELLAVEPEYGSGALQ